MKFETRKARKVSGQISEQISETSFQILRLFFGNFVQQKGGANPHRGSVIGFAFGDKILLRRLSPKLGLDLRLELPLTGVPRPSRPEIPKKPQKGLPGPPSLECQKSIEKVQNDPKRVKKVSKSVFGDFFRHFFDTPGGEVREDPFETFWAREWRLLHMGIAIVSLSLKHHHQENWMSPQTTS